MKKGKPDYSLLKDIFFIPVKAKKVKKPRDQRTEYGFGYGHFDTTTFPDYIDTIIDDWDHGTRKEAIKLMLHPPAGLMEVVKIYHGDEGDDRIILWEKKYVQD